MPPSRPFDFRMLALADANDIAVVHRAARDCAMPWLPKLHTPAEDRTFFATHVLTKGAVIGGFDTDGLAGFIALRDGWIDHLYVRPDVQGRGLGRALLDQAFERRPDWKLWTFQRNAKARAFYERASFRAVAFTDGQSNEEREPDVCYAVGDVG